jgi:hypothetical protein
MEITPADIPDFARTSRVASAIAAGHDNGMSGERQA